MMCAIKVLILQVKPIDTHILHQESGKDAVITTVMRFVCEGWLPKHAETRDEIEKFRKLSDSLSIYQGCLIHG